MSSRVSERVGQEIDKQQLRYSELLAGLAGGTIAFAASAVVLRPLGRNLNRAWLVAGFIVLGASILVAFFTLIAFGRALRWNYHYLAAIGKLDQMKDKVDTVPDYLIPIRINAFCLKKQSYWKKWLTAFLVIQSGLFMIGEAFLFVFVLWAAFKPC